MPKIIKKTVKPVLRSLAELNQIAPKTDATVEEQTVIHGEVITDTPEHDYEAAYQRREEEATTDFNALSREELEKEWEANNVKPMRPKPPGGYRIDGKFVSAAVWNAYMDQQENDYVRNGPSDDDGFLESMNDDTLGEDDDSNEAEVHSEDEDADMEASETAVAAESFADEHVVAREALIAELTQLVTICNYSQQVLRRAETLPLPQLKEYVATVRRNSGGSVSVASLIDQTQAQYEAALLTESTMRKLAMVDAKGNDFIKIAQNYQRVMGTDIVVHGTRHQEYHELLRTLTKHTSAIDLAITHMAERVGVLVPENLLLGGERYPVLDGAQINTKVAIYILNLISENLRVWAEDADMAQKARRAAEDAATKSRAALEQKHRELVSKNEEVQVARAKHEKATSNVLGYVITNDDGDYLCIKNENKPISMGNLTFTSVLQEAIIMSTKSKADAMESRVSDYKEIDLYVKPLALLEPYEG